MAAGLGYIVSGARQGQDDLRRRQLEEENRKLGLEDRERRIRLEDEDRAVAAQERKDRALRQLEQDAAALEDRGFRRGLDLRREERADEQQTGALEDRTMNRNITASNQAWTEDQRQRMSQLQAIEQERAVAKNEFYGAVRQAVAGNGVKPLEDWYNNFVGDDVNIRITQSEQGYFARRVGLGGGGEQFLGKTLNDVIDYGVQLLDPEVYAFSRIERGQQNRQAMLKSADMYEDATGALHFVNPAAEGANAIPMLDESGEPVRGLSPAGGGRGGRGGRGTTADILNVEHRAAAFGIGMEEAYKLEDMSKTEPRQKAVRAWFDAIMRGEDDPTTARFRRQPITKVYEAAEMLHNMSIGEGENLSDEEIYERYGVSPQ